MGKEASVHPISKFLPGLEVRHMLSAEAHRFPGLRVTAYPRSAIVKGEAAETANFDSLTLSTTRDSIFIPYERDGPAVASTAKEEKRRMAPLP